MITNNQKIKSIAIGLFSIGLSSAINAQCLSIACPGNMTIAAANGSCSAVVNYSAPVVTSTCAVSTLTFNYTGSSQNYTVPAGVNSVTLSAWGAQGWSGSYIGGRGAYASGVLTVTPGQVLTIFVGGQGTVANGNFVPAGGGFNGGGNGQSNGASNAVGGGGGASDVRVGGIAFANRVIVAAGGGGSTNNTNCFGGDGGTLIGITGGSLAPYAPGTGGSQVAGGNVGGLLGIGGSGTGTMTPWNGGGGGGYYGGGASPQHCGGGGGSSYLGGVTGGTANPGIKTGDGIVTIKIGSYTLTQTAGLPSGATFSVGTTVQTFSVVDSFSNSTTCSFSVVVTDAQSPTITCPPDTSLCSAVVSSIAPVSILDNCVAPAVTYTLLGATTGTGTTNASGTFSVGVTTVTYKATDASGNTGTCSFSVTVKAIPSVSVAGGGTICAGNSTTLTASGANTYSWNTGSTSSSIAVTPTANANYTTVGTGTNGCVKTVTTSVVVDPCTGLNNSSITLSNLSVYPNPNNGEFTISTQIDMIITIENNLGQVVKTVSLNQSNNHKVSVSNLANGIYFVSNTGNNVAKQKIIVSK